MTDRSRKVFRENDEGHFVPLDLVETEMHPSAAEVVTGLRAFVDASSSSDDLVIIRIQQARVLVERIDEIAAGLRKYADRIDGGQKTAPEASQEPGGEASSPPDGTRARSKGC